MKGFTLAVAAMATSAVNVKNTAINSIDRRRFWATWSYMRLRT